MELLNEFVKLESKSKEPAISVMTYNILADCYCLPNYFPYAQHSILSFTYRAPKILNEIKSTNADIICLQGTDIIRMRSLL